MEDELRQEPITEADIMEYLESDVGKRHIQQMYDRELLNRCFYESNETDSETTKETQS